MQCFIANLLTAQPDDCTFTLDDCTFTIKGLVDNSLNMFHICSWSIKRSYIFQSFSSSLISYCTNLISTDNI